MSQEVGLPPMLDFLSCQGNVFSKLGGSYSYPSLLACSADRTIKQVMLLWGEGERGHVDQKH